MGRHKAAPYAEERNLMFPCDRNHEAGVCLRVAGTMDGKSTRMISGPIPLNQRVAAGLAPADGGTALVGRHKAAPYAGRRVRLPYVEGRMRTPFHSKCEQTDVPLRSGTSVTFVSQCAATGIVFTNYRVAAGLAPAGGDTTFIVDNEKEFNLRT